MLDPLDHGALWKPFRASSRRLVDCLPFHAERPRLLAGLETLAYLVRSYTIWEMTCGGLGHPGGSFSEAETLAVLFGYGLRFDPADPHWGCATCSTSPSATPRPPSTRCSPCAGSSRSPICATTAAGDRDTRATPTPCSPPGWRRAAAPSGQIPGIAVGRALAIRRNGPDQNDRMVFVLVGDGECNEGSVWEAFMAAGHFRLDHLVFLIDANKVQAKGFVNLDMSIEPLARKLDAFNLDVHEVANGHDVGELVDLFTVLRAAAEGEAHRGDPQHGQGQEGLRRPVQSELAHLGTPQRRAGRGVARRAVGAGRPPARDPGGVSRAPGSRHRDRPPRARQPRRRAGPAGVGGMAQFILPDRTTTREMRYHMGFCLADLARENDRIVALDADLRSSTGLHIFEHFFPDRLVKCGIAEQNMAAMAAGFAQEGYIPFPCTFDSFSRRFMDQLYVSVAYGNLNVKFLGAYAGLFTGQGRRHAPERQGAFLPPARAEPAGDRARAASSSWSRPCAAPPRRPGRSTCASCAARSSATVCPRATGSSSARA